MSGCRAISASLLVLILLTVSLPVVAEPSAPAGLDIRYAKADSPDTGTLPGKLAIAGLLLIQLDQALLDIFPRTPSGQRSDSITESINSLGTGEVLLAVLGGIYLAGNDYDRDTARLAFAALLNAAVITQGLKMITGRARPSTADDHTVFRPGNGLVPGYGSFPSGHTSAAFSVATVLASRNPGQKWLYYGLASAVGLARVRKSAHFPSDVLVGAAVGILTGHSAIEGGPDFLSIRF